jgi:hypothetical protein
MYKFLLMSAALIPNFSHAATFKSFDVPGAYGTCGTAIASNGLVAGTTLVPESVATGSRTTGATTYEVTPFLYDNGRLTYPHANLPAGIVSFTGVNKNRFITALAFNASVTPASTTNFLYHLGQVTIPSAGGIPLLGLSGITDHEVILGQTETQPSGEFSLPRQFGFLLAKNGHVTPIDDGVSSLSPRAMDAGARHVVGTALGGPLAAWVFASGVFKPVAYPGNTFTFPTGVDEKGNISGSYVLIDSATGNPTSTHGFFLRHGVYTTYDVPRAGVMATSIGGMNEAGQITGCYADAKGTHGFIRTP